MKERTGCLAKGRRQPRHARALEQLEARCLLFGGALDDDLLSRGAIPPSMAGGLAGSPSLVESAPDGCGLTAIDQGLMAVDQGPSVADRGWLAGGGQPWSAATGDLELGGITCCCPACLAVADLDAPKNATALADAGPAGATVPLSSLPILNSLAGAAVSLYLNFVGHFEAFWGVYSNITTPAFNTDGDATTFSSAELDAIQTIWSIVAEDYAPFNINVTTVAPPNLNDGAAVMAVIGGNSSWTGGTYGGISYTGSFTSYLSNVAYVFSSNLGNNPRNVADATSHEAGHTFGLYHQSQYDANGNLIREYSTGTGDGRAPIMGNSYAATRSLWWNGTTGSANIYQDDMAVIASLDNGFGYRTDDHGNSPAAATTLTPLGSLLSGAGIIETNSDQDYFAFSTAAGQITLSVDVLAANINNLDARLELRDDAGNLIASAAPANTFSASITASVTAGNYLLAVASQGAYGDVGQYRVTVSVQAPHHAPSGTDQAITIAAATAYTLAVTDFGFVDPLDAPPDRLLAVRMTSLPPGGQLNLRGMPVVAGQLISANDISAGQLQFVPDAGASPTSFDFQVQDDGGTAGGGSDLDPVPNTLTLSWNGLLPATIVNRQLFYNNSYYDGYDPGISVQDDQAVAIDKEAYRQNGASATFQNVSSYSRGLNGLLIDVQGTHGALSPSDFEFYLGNDNAPQAWATAPQPTAISVRPGAGSGGTDRVQLVWPDGAIRDTWLRVTMKANANTGLAVPDTFYFGHALGDSGFGNLAPFIIVNTTDYLGPLNNARSMQDGVSVDNPFDYNRDGAVNVTDALIARNNATNLNTSLRLITLSEASPQFASQLPSPDLAEDATRAVPFSPNGSLPLLARAYRARKDWFLRTRSMHVSER